MVAQRVGYTLPQADGSKRSTMGHTLSPACRRKKNTDAFHLGWDITPGEQKSGNLQKVRKITEEKQNAGAAKHHPEILGLEAVTIQKKQTAFKGDLQTQIITRGGGRIAEPTPCL